MTEQIKPVMRMLIAIRCKSAQPSTEHTNQLTNEGGRKFTADDSDMRPRIGLQYSKCWAGLPASEKARRQAKRTNCAVQRAACRRECRRT